jgi:hypothetical protein
MIAGRLEDITENDIAQLCRSETPEGRMLEFKRDLPGDGREDKAEFLADATSLANGQGGDLVFGIEDKNGVAVSMPGVQPTNLDQTILRLENLLRTSADPRVVGAKFHWTPFAAGGGALILRVPPSFSGPHRNALNDRFYGRNSRGKYPMDTHELRIAFTAAEGLGDRIRVLHDRAQAASPFRLFPGPQAFLSVIPIAAVRDVRDIAPTPENALAPVRPAGAMRSLHTLEGVVLHTPPDPNLFPHYPADFVRTFALTHRRGHMHVGWSIGGERELSKGQISKLVHAVSLEQDLVGISRSAEAKLRDADLAGPWAVVASYQGLEGYQLLVTNDDYSQPAWRDGAELQPLLIDYINEVTLAPVLSDTWLLFGMVRPSDRKVAEGR